jgi:hypothetical protein
LPVFGFLYKSNQFKLNGHVIHNPLRLNMRLKVSKHESENKSFRVNVLGRLNMRLKVSKHESENKSFRVNVFREIEHEIGGLKP